MKLKPAILPVFALAGALSLAFAQHDEPKMDVSADKIAKIDAALPDKTPVPVQKKHEILVFTRTTGFRHSSIPVGVETLKRLGDKTGLFHVTQTEDDSAFEAGSLAKYGAVVMLNTTGEIFLNAAKDKERESRLQKNLLDFVSGGKGLIGIHSATDTYHGWREYNDMMGGTFDSHPWGSGTTERIRNLDAKNPVNASFNGEGFTIKDEIYKFRKDTALPTERRMLLALDPNGTDMTLDKKDQRSLYPVAWLDTWGKGRVFYCSLGHNDEIYMNPAIVKHYLAGLQFALGELPADATPQTVMSLDQVNDPLH
ncbi:MAG: ThuA domain-containing protein [Verrucomicrobiota bacterium]